MWVAGVHSLKAFERSRNGKLNTTNPLSFHIPTSHCTPRCKAEQRRKLRMAGHVAQWYHSWNHRCSAWSQCYGFRSHYQPYSVQGTMGSGWGTRPFNRLSQRRRGYGTLHYYNQSAHSMKKQQQWPMTRLVNSTLTLNPCHWVSDIESLTLSLWHSVSDIDSLTESLWHQLTSYWQIGVYRQLQDACWRRVRSHWTVTWCKDKSWWCPYNAKTHLMLPEKSHLKAHHHTQESPTKPW